MVRPKSNQTSIQTPSKIDGTSNLACFLLIGWLWPAWVLPYHTLPPSWPGSGHPCCRPLYMAGKISGVIATIANRLTKSPIVSISISFDMPSHRIVWHRLAKQSRRIASSRIIAWHRLANHRVVIYKKSHRIAIAYHRLESHRIA